MERLKKPIFLIGHGRTGSTIIYEAFARHEPLGWISQYNGEFPQLDFLSLLNRIYSNPFWSIQRGQKRQFKQGKRCFDKYLPRPEEAYGKWAALCGDKFRYSTLKDVTATESERHNTRKSIQRILRWQGKNRLACKLTGPPRIQYLHSIFPDAIFINIQRNPNANINSLLNFKHWRGRQEPAWQGLLSDEWREEWESYSRSEIALTAMHYRELTKLATSESQRLPQDQIMNILYEDFIQDPAGIISDMFDFVSLPPSPEIISEFKEQNQYKDMNYKFKDAFSAPELELIEKVLA